MRTLHSQHAQTGSSSIPLETDFKDYFGIEQKHCHITDQGFSVEAVSNDRDRMSTYRLRSEVYCDEYGWATSIGGYERDSYDDHAVHFCAKAPNGDAAGTIRTLNDSHDWMAETSFSLYFKESAEKAKNAYTNEGSRLAIQSDYRNITVGNDVTVLDLLLSALFHQNNQTDITATYFITFPILAKLMKKRGLCVTPVSEVMTMDDGCRIQAFVIDTTRLEDYLPYERYLKMLKNKPHFAA